jgi:hypothetical protein
MTVLETQCSSPIALSEKRPQLDKLLPLASFGDLDVDKGLESEPDNNITIYPDAVKDNQKTTGLQVVKLPETGERSEANTQVERTEELEAQIEQLSQHNSELKRAWKNRQML